MHFIDLLTPDRVECNRHAGSKKRVLELLSEHLVAAQSGEEPAQGAVMSALCAREKIGSTALGHGVALPHARLEGIRQPEALLLRLGEPVPFDAPDEKPVDLFFALLVPEDARDQHLNVLAQIAELVSAEQRRQHMRTAPDARALYELVMESQIPPPARESTG